MVNLASDGSDFEENAYENDVDDATHKRLIENILSLNKGKEVKKPVRTEPALEVSEYNLVKSGTGNKGTVHVTDLTKALRSKANHVEISKKIKSLEKRAKTLEKPLEKPQAERIKRSIAYENVTKQFDKWDPIVTSNRAANTLSFPLQYDTKLEDKVLARTPYRLKTDLQKKLEELEPKQEVIQVDMPFDKLQLQLEGEDSKPMLTMEELIEKRKEAAKLRAHQSYKEAKARRQNKIKSKKYHRIQRKEKIKQQMQEFEILQKTNPEAALKKLEEIEKARAEERLTLRHKSTGQWARSKQVRAKYDKESRQALSQQLSISKELTQKLKVNKNESSDEEEGEKSGIIIKDAFYDKDNPWGNNKIKPSQEINDFVSGYRKYWDEKNKTENTENNEQLEEESQSDNEDEEEDENDEEIKYFKENIEQLMKSPKKKSTEEQSINENVQLTQNANKNNKKAAAKKRKHVEINKNSLLNVSSTSDWDVAELTSENANKKIKRGKNKLENIDKDKDDKEIESLIESLEPKLKKKLESKVKTIEKSKKKKEKTKNRKLQQKTENNKAEKKTNMDLLALNKQVKRPELDEALQEGEDEEKQENNNELKKLKAVLDLDENDLKNKKSSNEEKLDPNKILNLKPAPLNTELPDLTTYDDNEEDMDTKGAICEAFEDDEIIADFQKDKQEDIDKNTPKDINLHLPGWGSWGGHNITESKKKKKRFIIKMPKKIPRRDDNKGNLTLNENADASLKPHLVNELPFPFKSVKDFEASVRAPIGSTFVPETAHRRLIKPAVTTQLGTIIEPITDDILIKKMKKR